MHTEVGKEKPREEKDALSAKLAQPFSCSNICTSILHPHLGFSWVTRWTPSRWTAAGLHGPSSGAAPPLVTTPLHTLIFVREEGHRSNYTCVSAQDVKTLWNLIRQLVALCRKCVCVCVCGYGLVLVKHVSKCCCFDTNRWKAKKNKKEQKWSLSQIVLYNLRCTQKYNSGRTLVKKYSLNKL